MAKLSELESLLINRCAYPKKINTPYGVRTVPCGKCLYCKKSHGRTLASLIHNEFLDSITVQYFTLTYHEFFLPRIQLIKSGNEDYPYTIPENSYIFRYSPDYERGTFKSTDKKTDIYFPLVYEQSSKCLKNAEFKLTSELINSYYKQSSSDIKQDNIGILFIPDIQNFFKRLRKNLHCTDTEQIRYFVLAEYGGTHFRPHFHILLFTKFYNAHDIQNAVFDSWHYGNIDYAGEPSDSASATNYVSNYVTASCSTPAILEQVSKTRTLHSKYFGLGFIKNNLALFLENPSLLAFKNAKLFEVNFYSSDNTIPIHTKKSSSLPSEITLQSIKSQLSQEYSLPYNSISSVISEETINIKVNNYILNYLFPRPFGYTRSNDYLTQLLLDSYDTFCKSNGTYEHYVNALFNVYINSSNEIYNLALGLYDNDYFKDTETPHSLKRNVTIELLDIYLIFYQLSKLNPDIKIFQDFKTYTEPINIINSLYSQLPPEYDMTPKQWAEKLDLVNDFHNRLLSTYFISKHFCINIKANLKNSIFYYHGFFNWNLYNKKRHELEQLIEKNQLSMYYQTLESNNLFPYECFLEDFNNNDSFNSYILPLQMSYLRDQTKHKELNNLLSPIFFDDTQYLTI